jgi:dihydrofolate reductase
VDTGPGAKGAVNARPFLDVAVSTSVAIDNTTQGETPWERSSLARTSRSTESFRTQTARRASSWVAGSTSSAARTSKAWADVELDEALRTEALLLGRRSDECFAERWQSRSGEWADRLNRLPKYVVSSTLEQPRWSNSTVLKGDVVNEVSKLKQELDGDLVVYASYQLGRTLIEHDLVDELRLIIFPVVLGAGDRLFGETSDKKAMRLVHARTVGDGLALLTYQFVRDA